MERIERIALQCAKECTRQNVGLDRVGNLIHAYSAAESMWPAMPTKVGDILTLGQIIEPERAAFFRKVPVTFGGIRGGVEPDAIPEAIERLVSHVYDAVEAGTEGVNAWVKTFLDIHPFADGNGRTAFVLFNWLGNTLDEAKPLPDYYGEEERKLILNLKNQYNDSISPSRFYNKI